MVYEILSPDAHGGNMFLGMHTESPKCIHPVEVQKAMVEAGHKISFRGTEEEYEMVKPKLYAKVKVTIEKPVNTEAAKKKLRRK